MWVYVGVCSWETRKDILRGYIEFLVLSSSNGILTLIIVFKSRELFSRPCHQNNKLLAVDYMSYTFSTVSSRLRMKYMYIRLLVLVFAAATVGKLII